MTPKLTPQSASQRGIRGGGRIVFLACLSAGTISGLMDKVRLCQRIGEYRKRCWEVLLIMSHLNSSSSHISWLGSIMSSNNCGPETPTTISIKIPYTEMQPHSNYQHDLSFFCLSPTIKLCFAI